MSALRTGSPGRLAANGAPGRLATVGALALAALAAVERPASAYCFTYDCDPTSGQCGDDPGDPADCPEGEVRLYWPVACIGFSLQEDASRQVNIAAFEPLAQAAFASWTNIDCGGGRAPSLKASYAGRIACDKQEYNQKGGNANALVFRDADWPYTGATNTLALTTLTFNTDTGEIYDADMEINATASMRLTTGDADVDKDLLSIVTHEAGHFLGMGHTQSMNAASTMFASYDAGTTTLRDLEPDDEQGICALYPPDRDGIGACDATPRHGYSGECGGKTDDDDGCTAAAPGGPASPRAWPLITLAGLAALGRRRRGAGGRVRP